MRSPRAGTDGVRGDPVSSAPGMTEGFRAMRAGPTQEEIRRHNLGALLRHVHVLGPMSRAELTARMGLNRSTIGALTVDLAEVGLVREELPRDHGRAGRPSLVVCPESARVYVLAFRVTADSVVAARVGLGGVILDRAEVSRSGRVLASGEAAESLAGIAGEMLRDIPAQAACVGSGVALGAAVRAGPDTDRESRALGDALAERLGLGQPAAVGNDADLGALAEHTRGVAAGCDDVVYLYGDVGLGAGIIVGGRLLSGRGGYGAEVGHMVVNPSGRPCRCGSRGCWETEIAEQALLRAAGREGVGREGVYAVVDAAARGDSDAQAALRRVGDWLGFGVANLVNIFHPEMVIFGGVLRDVYLAAAAQVRSRLRRMGLPASRKGARLRTPELGDDGPLIGAAELAFARLLADPLEVAAAPTIPPRHQTPSAS